MESLEVFLHGFDKLDDMFGVRCVQDSDKEDDATENLAATFHTFARASSLYKILRQGHSKVFWGMFFG